jgi:hypothetical protein
MQFSVKSNDFEVIYKYTRRQLYFSRQLCTFRKGFNDTSGPWTLILIDVASDSNNMNDIIKFVRQFEFIKMKIGQ